MNVRFISQIEYEYNLFEDNATVLTTEKYSPPLVFMKALIISPLNDKSISFLPSLTKGQLQVKNKKKEKIP